MTVHPSASAVQPPLAVAAPRVLQAAMAVCLGLFVVGFVGFSHLEIVHNAAHDTRHANAFPCQ